MGASYTGISPSGRPRLTTRRLQPHRTLASGIGAEEQDRGAAERTTFESRDGGGLPKRTHSL